MQRSEVLIHVWRVFPQKDRGIAASGFCLTLIKGGGGRNEVSGYKSQAKNSEELTSLTEVLGNEKGEAIAYNICDLPKLDALGKILLVRF